MILLWGSNARETHPIFFHHLLKGVHATARGSTRSTRGARRPRSGPTAGSGSTSAPTSRSRTRWRARSSTPGSSTGRSSSARPTGFDAYAASVEPYTLEEGERLTGVPAEVIRETAHAFARADRAMICWTLGITEHHNAVDNVLSLINLGAALRPRRPVRLRAQPAARPEQRAGRRRHGRDPQQAAGLPGHRARRTRRARGSRRPGARTIRPQYGWHLTQMFHAMERGELRTLYVIGENPAQSEADINRTRQLLAGLDLLVVQDIVLTRTAELADVVFPSSASWCETRGHGHEQRAARAARAQGARPAGRRARRHVDPLRARAPPRPRLGRTRRPRRCGTSCARSRRCTAACATTGSRRSAASSGRAPTRSTPARRSCTGGSGPTRSRGRARRSAWSSTRPPFEALDAEFPIRLTTGRRLESYNTGAQSNLLPLAAAPRRVARPLARGRRAAGARRRRGRARLVAARLGRGAGAHRPVAAARASRS